MISIERELRTLLNQHFRNVDAAAQKSIQAFLDCIQRDWMVEEPEFSIVTEMLREELQQGPLKTAATLQLLTYIRLCAKPGSGEKQAPE